MGSIAHADGRNFPDAAHPQSAATCNGRGRRPHVLPQAAQNLLAHCGEGKGYKQKQRKNMAGGCRKLLCNPVPACRCNGLVRNPCAQRKDPGSDQVQFGDVQVQLSCASRTGWSPEPAARASGSKPNSIDTGMS